MRHFKAENKKEAEKELKTDEILWDDGIYIEYMGRYFTAVTDEDFINNKENKLLHRKEKRKEKFSKRWN